MERLLARLERSFLGRFAIPNLPMVIVGGMAFAFVLLYAKPEAIEYLTLDPWQALHQPWRFVTFLFLPRYGGSLFWIFFSLYWTWLILSSLQAQWGAFRLTIYYVIGGLGTLAVALITGLPQGNLWLNTSLFFAFATLFPDYEILLFFIVPIKMKWLVIPTVGLLGWVMLDADNGTRAAIGIAFANYFLFFGGHLLAIAQGQRLQLKQASRRAAMRAPSRHDDDEDDGLGAAQGAKVCAICGAKQSEGADIRVCSCEKCGGSPRHLCLEHARNH